MQTKGSEAMTKAVGAREAHSLKIRAALISAGEQLLALHPIDAITINSIVETASVAKGSFYNHFPDKEALAVAVSTAIREEVEQVVTQGNLNVTDPAYKIVRGCCQHIRLAVQDPRRATIMLRKYEWATSADFALNMSMEKDLAEGIESSRFEPRCKDAGSIQILGSTTFTMLRILEHALSEDQAIALTVKVLALVLCGFGLAEEEATRIVTDSARDIIKA